MFLNYLLKSRDVVFEFSKVEYLIKHLKMCGISRQQDDVAEWSKALV